MNEVFDTIKLKKIDHVGIPQPEGMMSEVVERYFTAWDFHHFWSVDENIVASDLSSLRSTVVSDYDEKVKMPVFEPSPGQKKSQTQEFIEHNGGAGAQHIALTTDNIIHTVTTLRVSSE